MISRNRKSAVSGFTVAIACLAGLLLAASTLPASSALDRPGRRRDALRESLVRKMDIFAANYGDTDWSSAVGALLASPSDPANPAFISVPLSLANVYLNRYESGFDKADLERSVALAEWVVANHALWGRREGSGAVVSYLDITVQRLNAECDVGGLDLRIGDLWSAALQITAEEAEAVAGMGRRCGLVLVLDACLQSILPYPSEPDALASRAALLAAAAALLPEDPRAGAWGRMAREIVSSVPATSCGASDSEIVRAQGALSFRLSGGEVPDEFDSAWTSDGGPIVPCPAASSRSYETEGPVAAAATAESVDLAIRDSRVVAFTLSELYLWIFPPGSQCESSDGRGDIVPGQRAASR